jgi:hypothetical protein
MKPLRIAADTNLLLDLADEVESVLDALAVIDDRLPEAEKLVTPSVLDELAYLCDSGQRAEIRASARKAMKQLRQTKRNREGPARSFLRQNPNASLFINVISVGEFGKDSSRAGNKTVGCVCSSTQFSRWIAKLLGERANYPVNCAQRAG